MKKQWTVSGEEGVKVELNSLVDLSFLLLVFFLVTSTLVAREGDLATSLPATSSEPLIRTSPLVIGIEDDGRVVLHPGEGFSEQVVSADEGRELSLLASRLQVLKDSQRGVQLTVASEANYQRFIDVMNTLEEVGYDEVGIRDFAQ